MRTFIVLALAVILISGCANIKEAARGIAGISTKQIEEARAKASSKVFDYDYKTTYDLTKEILGRIKACIYTEDPKKNLIAIFVSETNTTPVGIFFTKIGDNKTQVEVSSPSTYAKELIAGTLFKSLEKGGLDDEKLSDKQVD